MSPGRHSTVPYSLTHPITCRERHRAKRLWAMARQSFFLARPECADVQRSMLANPSDRSVRLHAGNGVGKAHLFMAPKCHDPLGATDAALPGQPPSDTPRVKTFASAGLTMPLPPHERDYRRLTRWNNTTVRARNNAFGNQAPAKGGSTRVVTKNSQTTFST
jgi:hypothetical protein